jgi:hypothetical protein
MKHLKFAYKWLIYIATGYLIWTAIVFGYHIISYDKVVYAMVDGSCSEIVQVCELEPVGTWDNTPLENKAAYFCTCDSEQSWPEKQ